MSEWTVDTLREHFSTEIQGVRRETQLALDASKEAITKAEAAASERFAAHNEFRSQLTEQAATFMPREVVDRQLSDLRDAVDSRLPRETFEATLAEWQVWRRSVDEQLSTSAGARGQERRQQERTQPWMLWAAGLVLTAVVVVTNILT